MRDLYTQLPEEERTEEESTIGESIALQFYYGNFSSGLDELRELSISSRDFLNYLEDLADDYGTNLDDLYGGHFSPDFWLTLGQNHY